MQATVRTLYQAIDALAPFGSAEAWDNVGLLVGDMDRPVTRVLMAMDVTRAVAKEARSLGADVIISHHPILFHPLKALRTDTAEGALLSTLLHAQVALITAHTNWDKAQGGVQDALAEQLALDHIRPLFLGRIGRLKKPLSLDRFAKVVSEKLCDPLGNGIATRVYGHPEQQVQQIAVAGGAGMDEWQEAKAAGADVLVTGDIKHHQALDALAAGLCLIDAGHIETEWPGILALQNSLQKQMDALQCKVRFLVSTAKAYEIKR